MRACLTEEELFALVDGAASEKEATLWRKHVEGCERCSASLKSLEKALAAIAEDEPLDVKKHADAVMAALDRAPAKRQRVLVPLAVSGLALAAALLLGIGIGRGTRPYEFTARGGGAEASLQRDVALDVMADGRRVKADDEVPIAAAFTASARNVGTQSASALVFLVDANREVHWLYPAYDRPGTNPSSVTIAASSDFGSLGDGVSFSDVAPGPATLVTVITPKPMTVSEIETRSDRTAEGLQRAFPSAEIRAVPIRMRAP